jgi:hypothetical protein
VAPFCGGPNVYARLSAESGSRDLPVLDLGVWEVPTFAFVNKIYFACTICGRNAFRVAQVFELHRSKLSPRTVAITISRLRNFIGRVPIDIKKRVRA